MTVSIGGVHAAITGDSTGFKVAFREATAELQKSRQQMTAAVAAMNSGFNNMTPVLTKISSGVGTVSTAIKGFIALKAVEYIRSMVEKSLEAAAAIADLSSRLGLSTTQLQQLAYAGKQSNLTLDDTASLLDKLNKTIAESGSGNGTILDKLGIAARDSQGNFRSAADVLNDLADAYQNAGSAAERSRILVLAFGRDGAKAANLLENGSAGIKKLSDEAERLGVVLSEGAVKQGKEANDALSRLGSVGGAAVQKFFLSWAPAITAIADGLTDVIAFLGRTIDLWNEFIGNIEQLSTKKIQDEIVSLNAQIDKFQAQIANNKPSTGGRTLYGADTALADQKTIDDAKKQILQLELLLEERQRDLAKIKQSGTTPSLNAPSTDKVAEYIRSLQQEISLLYTDASVRDEATTIQRAQNIAEQEWRDGKRKSKDLTADEIKQLRGLALVKRDGEKYDQQRNRDMQDAKTLIEQLRTPQEVYIDQFIQLNRLLAEGYINQEEYNRGLAKAKQTLEETDPSLKRYHEAVDQIGQAFESFGESLAETGKIGKDAFKQLIDAITQTIFKLYILKPLIDSLFGSQGGGGGIFGNLLGGLFSGGSSSGVSAGIGAAAGAVGSFAGGGSFKVGGAGGTDSQLIKFWATPGEAVDIRTPGQDRGPVGGNQVVIIHNNTDAQATTQQGVGPNGEQQIEVMIDRVVGKAISRRGSNTNKALTETFRQVPVLAKR